MMFLPLILLFYMFVVAAGSRKVKGAKESRFAYFGGVVRGLKRQHTSPHLLPHFALNPRVYS